MVALEKHRSALLRATEFVPVCSACGWTNSGNPVLTITDAAMEGAVGDWMDRSIAAHLLRAQEHHECKAGS
jgi:hypothetical protein